MNSEFDELREQFEDFLKSFIDLHYGQAPLGPVMHYAMAGQGKRIRPLFCLLSTMACGANSRLAFAPALAVEMVHTYSLVHDDLPCMDDDDLRRGRATTHTVYGEDWALLAGDGLLTDAFTVICDHCDQAVQSAARLLMVRELAAAAGSQGMVEGQAQDIYWTARNGATIDQLDRIHRLKTGALIGASCAVGAVAAGGSVEQVNTLRQFGQMVGWAFQIRDDIIDQLDGIGKTAGKDLESGKLTYLALMSREQAEAAADKCTKQAIDLVSSMGQNGYQLKKLATLLLERNM